MPSTNADFPDIEAGSPEAEGAQEYVEACALGYLKAPKLAAEEAELADLNSRRAPNPFAVEDPAERNEAVYVENTYKAQLQHVRGLRDRRDAAIAFATGEGTYGNFSSMFGYQAQRLISNGLVDEGAVGEAVKAAYEASQTEPA